MEIDTFREKSYFRNLVAKTLDKVYGLDFGSNNENKEDAVPNKVMGAVYNFED